MYRFQCVLFLALSVSSLALVACGDDGASTPADASLGLPGAPTSVTAEAKISQGAIVTWAAPSDPGTTAISQYVVTATPGGATTTVDATRTMARVTGLTVGTDYTFTVHAVNAGGNGPASDPSGAVTIVEGPAAPAVSACGGTGKITIKSAPSAGATSYNLYVDTTTPVSLDTATKLANVTFPHVVSSGLTNGTTYYYVATAVDANAVESAASGEAVASPSAGLQNTMFASSYNAKSVTITDCFSLVADGANGVSRTLTGTATGLDATGYSNLFVDAAARRLYTTTRGATPKVLIWDNADTVDGDMAATRTLSGGNTGLSSPRGVFVTTQNDRLYVAEGSSILIWANASTVTGDVAPAAVLTGSLTTIANVQQIYVDAINNVLYVTNGGNPGAVLAFANASSLAGTVDVAPARTLTFDNNYNQGVWLDSARDLLYVGSNLGDGYVYAIANGSTANGAQTSTLLSGAALDATTHVQIVGDTLYVLHDGKTMVSAFDDAHTKSGTVTATRTVETGLTSLGAFFVVP